MWKPGASKPASASSSSSSQPFAALAESSSSSTRKRGGTSRSKAEPETDEREARSETTSKSPSEPLRTKALSGATLNMRFMKRGTPRESAANSAPAAAPPANRKSPQRPAGYGSTSRQQSSTGKPTSAVASLRFLQDYDGSPRPRDQALPGDGRSNDDVEMADAAEDHDMEEGQSDQEAEERTTTPLHHSQQRGSGSGAALVVAVAVAVATPADMYGGRGNLLGRRSFGKFNSSAEANWSAALRHAGGGGESDDGASGGSRRRRKQQERGRQQHERPIGNLDSKMPRSHSNNSSSGGRSYSQGKKRKTMISDVS
jgi:hypothetical protein